MKTFTKHTSRSEVLGLQEIAATQTIRTPKIISFENDELVLEFISSNQPTREYWERLGKNLAKHHQVQKTFFGWNQDGFIGLNPQINPKCESWSEFFVEHRLQVQMDLLTKKSNDSTILDFWHKTKDPIRNILNEVIEPSCLLHGDLWNGNVLCDSEQQPILIDPAIYYGHRETDLAMMKLFGGFDPIAFDTYQIEYPLKPGWQQREKIYQLYHLLNHLNIFGSSYESQTKSMLRTLF